MNLATTLPIVLWLACAISPVIAVPASEAGPQSDSTSTGSPQQSPSPAQPSSGVAAPQTSSAPTQTTNPKPHKRKINKKTDKSGCDAAASKKTTANGPMPTAGAKETSANCPPAKTVVRNGGTSEPAVQLTEGEGAAQAQQRSTTDQLLGSTEDNLKKIAGRQLTSAQQDMVSQIRQYMQQSKEAVTAGDAERSRMLAQKAQLLSDELVKP
ncbi:MAG: hypothetical protein WB729_08835 [Candidatus Sulfotelmatobacter sp.]